MPYGHMQCSATRKECADWIEGIACPGCKAKRLMPGPDYDRFFARCLNCGWHEHIRPPKRFLHAVAQS